MQGFDRKIELFAFHLMSEILNPTSPIYWNQFPPWNLKKFQLLAYKVQPDWIILNWTMKKICIFRNSLKQVVPGSQFYYCNLFKFIHLQIECLHHYTNSIFWFAELYAKYLPHFEMMPQKLSSRNLKWHLKVIFQFT